MVVGAAKFVAAIRHIRDLPAGAICHEHLRLVVGVLVALPGRAYDTYNLPRAPPLIVRLLFLIPMLIWCCPDNEQIIRTQSVLGVEGAGQAPGRPRCEKRERDDFVDRLGTATGDDLVQL
jgi:hypothetical protein